MNHLICLSLAFLSLMQPLIMAVEIKPLAKDPAVPAQGGGTDKPPVNGHEGGAKNARSHGAHRKKSEPGANNVDAEKLNDASAQGAGVHSSDAHLPTTGPPADIGKACALAKDKDFCIKTLTANPKSKGLDMKQLALLAVQMVQDKGMEIQGYIDEKLQQEESIPEDLDDALNDCSDQYSDSLAQIDDVIDALFNSIPYNDVRTWLSAAATSAVVCQKEITESNAKNMFEDNGNVIFGKLCENALSIVTSLQTAALQSGTAKALS